MKHEEEKTLEQRKTMTARHRQQENDEWCSGRDGWFNGKQKTFAKGGKCGEIQQQHNSIAALSRKVAVKALGGRWSINKTIDSFLP